MSDARERPSVRDLIAVDHLLRRARSDSADRDAVRRGELDPEDECICNFCWAENYATVRALRAVAAPGMSEHEIEYAVAEHIFGPGGLWAGRDFDGD